MSQPVVVNRPGGITLIVVIMYFLGILEILGGFVYLWLSFNPSQIPNTLSLQDTVDVATAGADLKTVLLWAGAISILLGLLTIFFANGLKNGSNGVRIFVTILVVLQILVDAYEMAALRGNAVWGNLIGILLWLIVLGILWSSRASAFFHQRS